MAIHYSPYTSGEEIIGRKYDWVSGSGPTSTIKASYAKRGELYSFGHKPDRDGVYRTGDPFWTHKYDSGRSGPTITVFRPGGSPKDSRAYVGSFAPSTGSMSDIYASSGGMWGTNPAFFHGADAWTHARARLTKPDFSLLQPIYELRELPNTLRSLTGKMVKDIRRYKTTKQYRNEHRGIGDYYLAQQFGWAPLWRDIAQFLKAHRGAQPRVEQLIRDEGRPVMRSGTLSRSSSKSKVASGSDGGQARVSPSLVSQCYWGPNPWSVENSADSHVWYVGKFRYWLPPGPKSITYKKQLMRALYSNYRITPEVAYNIIPWSWMVDWYADLGTFMSAVSGGVEDRLAADYFYVMKSSTQVVSHSVSLGTYSGPKTSNKQRNVFENRREIKSRSRAVASPFGWGLSEDSLTPTQWGILGALGLSRL